MRKLRNLLAVSVLAVSMVFGVTGCQSTSNEKDSSKEESVTLSLAAAASLEKCFTEKLIPMFEKEHDM